MTATATAAGAPVAHPRTPVHLWIVGGLTLLWNAMGVFDFLATQTRFEAYMSQFTEAQLDYFYGFPAWVVVAWGAAVFGGFLGSLGLLLRKRWAVGLFGLSILAMALTSIYSFLLTDGSAIMSSGELAFSAVIWVVAILLFLYARRQAAHGVLR